MRPQAPKPSKVRNPTCFGLQTTHRTVIMRWRLSCLVLGKERAKDLVNKKTEEAMRRVGPE
jgi:hypothetical protein